MVPATGHDVGSSSPASRIFSTTVHTPPVARASRSTYCSGSRSPSGWSTRSPSTTPVGHPPQDQLVGVGEHLGVLDPQADEGVDVEEPAVAELTAGGAPVGDAVVLLLEQGVEGVDVGVEVGHRGVDRGPGVGAFVEQPGELAPQDLVVSVAFGHRRRVGPRRRREAPVGAGHVVEVVVAGAGRGVRQQAAERPRRHGQHVVEVADEEPRPVPLDRHLAPVEHPSVVVAEDRQEDRVAQLLLGWVPRDVEVPGPRRRRPVLEHVPPPAVLGAGDGHVVGDDVEHLAQRRVPQRGHHPGVAGDAAEVVARPGGVDDVVAVGRPGRGLEHRRQVGVRHAEVGEVPRHRGRVVEPEPGVELEPVGRERRGHGGAVPVNRRRRAGAGRGSSGRPARPRPPPPRRPLRAGRSWCRGCGASGRPTAR